jgi:hypothetical protein
MCVRTFTRSCGYGYSDGYLPHQKQMSCRWTIHDEDGEYVGESRAIAPKVAYLVFLCEQGREASLGEIWAEPLPDGSTRITHDGRTYLLKRADK